MKVKNKPISTEVMRIIYTESIVKQLEMMYAHMREENGGCTDIILRSYDYRKYGFDRGGLIDAVLGNFLEIKNHETTK